MGDDRDKKKYRQRNRDRAPKISTAERILDKVLATFAGPAASSLIRLIATALIAASSFGIVLSLAIADAASPELIVPSGLFAALSTAAIWFSGFRKSPVSTVTDDSMEDTEEEIEKLQSTIVKLEERLANVEMIESFEERLADKQIEKSLRPSPSSTTTYGSDSLVSEG